MSNAINHQPTKTMPMTPEEREARKEQRRITNLELKRQAEEIASRINNGIKNGSRYAEDAARRRYINYNGWSKVPSTGQRFRRQGC